MKPRTITRNIKAAGFTLSLCFKDTNLACGVKLPFPCSAGARTPSAIIEIYTDEIEYLAELHVTNGMAISGEGEYEGYFDIRNKKGGVVLLGGNNEFILANFLTRVFSLLVSARSGLMIHGACLIRNGQAYIFHGVSGAGKSTACSFSPDCAIASDDITAVRKLGRRYLAWGIPQLGRFPIPEKHGPCTIAGFFRLIKDPEVSIHRISGAQAAAGMLALQEKQLTPQNIRKMLVLLADLADHAPCYELHFRKDATFWHCIDKIKGSE